MRDVGGDAVALLVHGPLVLRQVRVARADVPLLQMLQLTLQVEPISLNQSSERQSKGDSTESERERAVQLCGCGEGPTRGSDAVC